MSWILDRLELDPAHAVLEISDLLQSKLQEMEKDGILIGLSGGLDSAIVATLCVRALGKEKVTLLNLPDRDSKAIHQRHAGLVARDLGVRFETVDITPPLKAMGIYGLLPIGSLPGRTVREWVVCLGQSIAGLKRTQDLLRARLRPTAGSLVAKGNAYAMAKHRLRMVLLYYRADVDNLMVVGAANKTEWLTGTFAKWGCDHCADVMPIVHLYRSQLPALAQYLGVPEAVRSKSADPDLMPGIDDKEALLGTFAETDQILWGLENGLDRPELVQLFGTDAVEHIATLRALSRPMREAPYRQPDKPSTKGGT